MFIDGDVCRPNYDIIEEGENDGEGNFIKMFERQSKIYVMDILVNEFQLDAFYTIPQHDRKMLHLKNGESEEVKDVALKHEFVSAGIAKLTMTFRTRYVIKTNCCVNQNLVACIAVNKTAITDFMADDDLRYTDPLNNGLSFGDRYIIRSLSNTVNEIMTYGGTGWVAEAQSQLDYVLSNGDGMNYLYYGTLWIQCPSILVITPTASTIKITGMAMPNSFVQIEYKKTADVAWTTWITVNNAPFNNGGNIITGLDAGTDYDVRFLNYNHNCAYGYSNTMITATL